MNSLKRFDKTKLPGKKDLCSSLKDEHISDEDNEHAMRV